MKSKKQPVADKTKSLEPIKESQLTRFSISPYERPNVLHKGLKQLNKLRAEDEDEDGACIFPKDMVYQMLTLFEFDKGMLISEGFGTSYKSIVIDLSKQFQTEFDCKTASEKATAHLAAQNYVRTLELQKYLSSILNAESYTDLSLRRYQMVSKAYDQANHQYLFCIQTLRQMKQPPINVIVKTGIANIAQNQVIQENQHA